MFGDNSQEHIRQFLKDNPHGHLYVVVGFASVWGLAWLQDHTRGRPVTLLIGNTQESRFQVATDSDRRKALDLLRRPDVQVLNWYRTPRSPQGNSTVHAKAWIVADLGCPIAALIGSANLTKEGLQNNWEMMASVAYSELPLIWSELDGFLKGRRGNKPPWDHTERLDRTIAAKELPQWERMPDGAEEQTAQVVEVRVVGALETGGDGRTTIRSPRRPRVAPGETSVAKRKGGCLLFFGVALAVATVSLLIFALLFGFLSG